MYLCIVAWYINCCTEVTDVNIESLLDKAMGNLSRKAGCIDIALYLINHGCPSNDGDRAKLLCEACKHGKLEVVKELVEQHHVIPSGKHTLLATALYTHTCV